MTTTCTTEAMLAEIGMGTAAELAMGVGFNTSPPGPIYIPELDSVILSSRPHLGGSSLQRGDLVEIIGPSGSGKTTLATFLLMTTLLPPSLDLALESLGSSAVHSVPLGGRNMHAALLCPPSQPPPIAFLASTMRAHVDRCYAATLDAGTNLPDPELRSVQAAIDQLVESALERLTVLRPRPRSANLAIALRRILTPPDVLRHDGTVEGPRSAPAMVVCDGLSDGFWPERWAEEDGGVRRGVGAGPRTAEEAGMREVWDALTALRSELGAVVIVTIQGLRSVPNTPFFKTHLPAPYPSPYAQNGTGTELQWPLNVQITLLGPPRALQLPAETTLTEALRGRTTKDVRVYNGIVRVPGGAGAVGGAGGGRFSFGVHEHGLVPFNTPST